MTGSLVMDDTPWRLIGTPRFGGILVVADHAGWDVPPDMDLGLPAARFGEHIAQDIGTMAVAELMAAREGTAAFVGRYSRLVCDLNRDEDAPCLVPVESDGVDIPGNAPNGALDDTLGDAPEDAGRAVRLARFHRPYHARLAALLEEAAPALILSLHSFTPALASRPEVARPWQVGVLYNQDDRLARRAIPLLAAEGLMVGDQQPYSGRDLNYTMNRHAEAEGRPYLGVEIRQDEIAGPEGQARWAARLAALCNRLALG